MTSAEDHRTMRLLEAIRAGVIGDGVLSPDFDALRWFELPAISLRPSAEWAAGAE